MHRLVSLLVALVLVAACAGDGGGTVTGLVVDVQGDLTAVTSFTLLTEEGERLRLVPAEDGDFAFPLPHLRDHLRSGERVVVTYLEEQGELVATAVDDADRSHRLP